MLIERDGKKQAPLQAQFSITREAGTPAKDGKAETPGWVSVSSEQPVMSFVYFNKTWQRAYVVLSHADGAIQGDWTKDGVVLRDGHYGDTCGRLLPAYVRDHKLGGDKIVWSASERAQVLMRDVESGVRRDISVEGDWDDKDLVLDGEKDGIPVIRAARWTPLAAAIVDVRADPKVGVARSNDATPAAQPESTNPGPTTESGKQPAPAKPVVRSKSMTPEELAAQEKQKEIARGKEVADIVAMGAHYSVPQEIVTRHLTECKSLSDFRDMVMRDYAGPKAKADADKAAKPVNEIKRGAQVSDNVPAEKLVKFSFLRAIMGLAKSMNPGLDLPKFDDGLEREVSQESVRLIRATEGGETYQPRGLCIPWDLVRRDHNGRIAREFNIAGTGSNVVAQDLRPELFIDYLRAKLILAKLGVTMLPGLVGDVLIPKQSGTASGGWVDETTAATAGTLTVGQIKVTPRTVGAYTDISRQLLLQSTPSADMLVMNDLVDSIARTIQTGAFHGTGANNQPTGLATALSAGYQGYAAITEATVSSDGSPTYAEAEAMLGLIEEANVDGLFKWALRPKAFRYFKTLGRVGTTGAVPAAVEDKGVKYLADLVAETTTSLTSKYAFAGRWDSMVLAMWGALDLTLDPYSLSTRGALRVVALQSVDVGFRYLPAFGWSSKFPAAT
ncbi:MAG: phage major capsid protein [Bryobacteraceae bacterium]